MNVTDCLALGLLPRMLADLTAIALLALGLQPRMLADLTAIALLALGLLRLMLAVKDQMGHHCLHPLSSTVASPYYPER